MKKLNVGCGLDKKEGWVNLDFDRNVNPDVVYDLSKIYGGGKLPFKDNFFDYVYLSDVLEHFSEPLPLLRELWRVVKPYGKIEIKVPYGDNVWINLDHKRFFLLGSFDLDNFDFTNTTKKAKVRIILKQIYFQPVKSIIKKIYYSIFLNLINGLIKKKSSFFDQTILKYLFPTVNIRIIYQKLV